MKKLISLAMILLVISSTFSVLAPHVKASSSFEPEVVCVPFHGTLLGVPHDAWIGKEIVLKGTAHDPDGDSTLEAYKWDFGDGYSTDWIAGVNPYISEAKHTYTGTMADGTPYGVGKYFTAWLHVKDADGLVGQDSYFIAIRDKTLDVEVNVAIDDGLWWLHKQAYRYTSDGTDYARWPSYSSYYTSATAESVLAFEIQGHQPIGNPDEDPYVETVQRGLNYVFSKTRVVDISAWGPGTNSPYGDPDTNGNDIGIGVTNNREPYELGMVMMAIAASGDPDLIANTGPTGVVGRAYTDILTDMVDICAWGQNDYGCARGGWRYAWNYGSSDNSVSQWPIMALEAAETNWGITTADFVKTELDTYWLTYSQNADGSFGYSGPGGSNIARTGTGIIGLNYLGLLADNPRIANAVNWLGNHWSEFGNYYGMYAVMKGMRTANPEITMVGSHDWYAEYAQYLVNNQQADGGWPNYYGRVLASDWAILILTPTVTKPGPVADAGLDVESYPPTIPLEFDASGSYHLDPTKDIVLYEWDFDSDGTWDYSGTDLTVQHSYPAYYVLAELVKAVIGADYLWGGKGWDLNEKRFVEPHEIKEGYNYWNPSEGKIDFGSGVDCSGLAFWSYNKMVGTANYEDSILPEGAQGQWEVCEKIDKDDLRLGDLLFFDEYPVGDEVMNHVAMYVGSFFYDDEEYNVVHASGFTNTVTPAHYDPENEMLTTIKVTDETQTIDVDGYGRVTNAPAPDSIIDWDQTARDYTATLRVTDNADPALQDTDTCVVHITSPPWKPVADPNGPYEGFKGFPTQLDGSKSYDPESRMYPPEHPWYETIAKYEWDLDNDGQFDDSTEVNPSYTWNVKGTYSVGLKVTDSHPSGEGGTIGPLDVDIKYVTVVIVEALERVTVTIVEVRAIDTMDPFGGAADFYAKASIDGQSLPDKPVYKGNDDDIYPEWTFSLIVSKTVVSVHIEIWDSDLVFDDHVDIDKDSSDRDLDFSFNITDQSLTGDVTYGYSGGGGDSNRAEIWFNVGLGSGDRDGDGLFDSWESTGIHMDDDGEVDLDLPALGAKPDHKDIFLEVDWMQDATHSHRPRNGVPEAIVNAFDDAPVSNPDGTTGINIHIDVSKAVPHQDALSIWDGFDAIKAINFDENRRFVYHYCLFIHNMQGLGSTSGIAELPGNDFIVSLGSWTNGVGTFKQQAGTLMHELGHNLNLRHGGGDHTHYKPNFLSIMNYHFQMSGIPPTGRLDYSRIVLPSLNEDGLDENLGIQDGADNTKYFPPSGNALIGTGFGPIDWDNDGIIETNVEADINRDGSRGVLDGYDDWSNILYNPRGTGDFEDGIHLTSESLVELDIPTYESIKCHNIEKFAEGPQAIPLFTKAVWNFTYTMTNVQEYEIFNVVVKDHFGANLDVAFISSTRGTYTQYTNKPGRQQRFKWTIGNLAPWETVTLKLKVSTGTNPAKKQKFTEAGLKVLNSGATVKWLNASGRQGSAESGQISIWAGVSVSDTTGAIAGYVTNAITEEPLRGYVIELRDSTGSLVATTTTGKNGFYAFSSLAPTDYTVICSTQSYTATVTAEQVKRIDFEFD